MSPTWLGNRTQPSVSQINGYTLGPVISSVCVLRSKPVNGHSAEVRILEVALAASPSLPAFVAGLSFHYLHSVLAVWDH